MSTNYAFPPPLHQTRESPSIRPVMVVRVMACLGGMGFCGLTGLYCLAVWSEMISADSSALSVSMAGPYATAAVVAGVGFFLLTERFLAAFDDR